MKKQLSILLFSLSFMGMLYGTNTLNENPLTAAQTLVNTNYFVTMYYHQLRNDAAVGTGNWLDSLFHNMQFQKYNCSEKELSQLINNSPDPIIFLQKIDTYKPIITQIHSLSDYVACDKVRICFATPFLENPLSLFGHVFIEFYQKDNPFFSYCLSFLGDTQNVKPVDILINGLTGKLKGTYSIQPFYLLYDKYVIKENRNIISYDIELTKDEKQNFIHIVSQQYFQNYNYSFLFNNCMDGIFKLLVDVKGLPLDNNSFINAPADLINKLLSSSLLSNERVYTTIQETQDSLYSNFSHETKKDFNKIMKSNDKISLLSTLPQKEQTSISTILSSYYYVQFRQNNHFNKDYESVMNNTSPNIPIRSTTLQTTISQATGYIESDLMYEENKPLQYQITFRPIFSDIGEQLYSKNNQESFEFGKFRFNYDGDDFSLLDITWIKLISFHRITRFQKKLSWQFESIHKIQENESPFINTLDIGFSIGKSKIYLFSYIGNTLQFEPINYEISFGFNLWFIEPQHLICSIKAEETFYSDLQFDSHFECLATLEYFLKKNQLIDFTLHLSKQTISIGYRYYFNLI